MLGYNDRKVTWTVSNTGSGALTIDTAELAWPAANKKLKKIKLDGGDIFTTQTLPPAVTVTSGWHDDASRRRAPGPSAPEHVRLTGGRSAFGSRPRGP